MTTVFVKIQFCKKSFFCLQIDFFIFGLYFEDTVKGDLVLIMKLKLTITSNLATFCMHEIDSSLFQI